MKVQVKKYELYPKTIDIGTKTRLTSAVSEFVSDTLMELKTFGRYGEIKLNAGGSDGKVSLIGRNVELTNAVHMFGSGVEEPSNVVGTGYSGQLIFLSFTELGALEVKVARKNTGEVFKTAYFNPTVVHDN